MRNLRQYTFFDNNMITLPHTWMIFSRILLDHKAASCIITVMNNIKIICTIGPATSSLEQIRGLVAAGMNIARLNFSHGLYEEHQLVIDRIKKIREETGRNIGILQDLCGPKIRTGELPEEGVELVKDSYVRLTNQEPFRIEDNVPVIPVSYGHLLTDIKEGKKILMDDGQLSVVVEKCEKNALLCLITDGGILKRHKGVNFPGLILSQAVPTEKDLRDLEFGIKNGVDFVALSFVQNSDQVTVLKQKIQSLGGTAWVIAKLEREQAVKNLDSIIQAADGIMVARGDLGIETDIAMVPVYQKLIIRKSNLNGKPVITATQMLESMIHNSIPTRAEANDVANAIYDGSDAIMLSGETAVGEHPLETVRTMRRIADNVEQNLWLDRSWLREKAIDIHRNTDLSIAHAICKTSQEIRAAKIIANTITGQTARRIALFKPRVPIIAITPTLTTFYHLSLVWGIRVIYNPVFGDDFYGIINNSEKALKKHGLVNRGDIVVMSAGTPSETPGGTNIMKVHKIG